jgi:single-strand DNA-binding protein
MSRTLNKVMLIGNVGRDPDMKYTPSGIPVSSFRLATSESWKDREGSVQEHTDWHTIVAWRGLAEIVNKLVKKGTRVYIEGKLQTRTFEDKNGAKRHVVEVLADNMLLLDTRRAKDAMGGDYVETGNLNEEDFDLSDFSDDSPYLGRMPIDLGSDELGFNL